MSRRRNLFHGHQLPEFCLIDIIPGYHLQTRAWPLADIPISPGEFPIITAKPIDFPHVLRHTLYRYLLSSTKSYYKTKKSGLNLLGLYNPHSLQYSVPRPRALASMTAPPQIIALPCQFLIYFFMESLKIKP